MGKDKEGGSLLFYLKTAFAQKSMDYFFYMDNLCAHLKRKSQEYQQLTSSAQALQVCENPPQLLKYTARTT